MAVIHVRHVTDADDLDALNHGNFSWWGEEKQRQLFASGPPVSKAMFVGELDGAPVGYGHGVGAPIAAHGYGIATVYVLPQARRNGVGRRLLDEVAEVVRCGGVPGVTFSIEYVDLASRETAKRWGLVEDGHHFESMLDLAATTDETVERAVTHAASAGYVVDPLPDDANDDTWRMAYLFLAERFREAPDARDGGGEIPYEIFRTFAPQPWHVVMAYRDGKPVGITTVTQRPDGVQRMNTFFTGVHPDHRGRGLSTALKATHAQKLRDAGWRELWTQNMETNTQILAANDRLGFTRVGGYVDMGLAFR